MYVVQVKITLIQAKKKWFKTKLKHKNQLKIYKYKAISNKI